MTLEILRGVLLPFWGTALGAGAVLFLRGEISGLIKRSLDGFAAGVMTAASVFSLLIPAMEGSQRLGCLSFLPAAVGFLIGAAAMLALDRLILRLRAGRLSHSASVTALAVVLHNLPEGMAVGVVYAARLSGGDVTAAAALALSVGIAVQNFPEGAIISMPLCAAGVSKPKSLVLGILSGAVEPVGALLTLSAVGFASAALPYLLSFAAGAMIYVVAEELIPEMSEGEPSALPTALFSLGFVLMMSLDVALG